MTKKLHLPLILVASAGLAACEPANESGTTDEPTAAEPMEQMSETAIAPIMDAQGNVVGEARITGSDGNLGLALSVTNLPTGMHGVHIHQTGLCDPPDFTSAGGHWNPGDKQHGLDNPQGSHMGDMPNLAVGEDGIGTLTYDLGAGSIEGGANPLLDEDGAAFVVHAGEDDQKTDPSGDSGDRIACGVFARS